MTLPLALHRFGQALHGLVHSEEGAITIEWTTVTAALVGLAITSVSAVSCGSEMLAIKTGASLSGAQVNSLGELGSMP